jgi:hypothetical protein
MSRGLGKIEREVLQCLTDCITKEKEIWGYECDSTLLRDLVNEAKKLGMIEPSIRRAIKSLSKKEEIFIYFGYLDGDIPKALYVSFNRIDTNNEQYNPDDFLPNDYSSRIFDYEKHIIDTLANNGGECKQSFFSQQLTPKGFKRDRNYAKGNERAVKKLLNKGIIYRVKSNDDKRTYTIKLSEKYITDNQIKILPPMTETEIENIKIKLREDDSKRWEQLAKSLVENAYAK